MKHAAVALDYEQRIASLEADNRAMGQAIMEMAALLEAPVGKVEPEAKRKRRGKSYPRHSRNKPLSSQGDDRKMKRPGEALASPTRPDHNAVAEGQAS